MQTTKRALWGKLRITSHSLNRFASMAAAAVVPIAGDKLKGCIFLDSFFRSFLEIPKEDVRPSNRARPPA